MHTWEGGKQDDQDIADAEYIMRRRFGLDADIRREPFVAIPHKFISGALAGGPGPRVRTSMPMAATLDHTILHPDLCLVGGRHGDLPLLIVEIDGSYHDSRPGRKATDRRDRAYREAGIPFVAIRKSEYPGGGDGWQTALEAMIARPRKTPGWICDCDDDDGDGDGDPDPAPNRPRQPREG